MSSILFVCKSRTPIRYHLNIQISVSVRYQQQRPLLSCHSSFIFHSTRKTIATMTSDAPINPKWAATIALSLISMLILIPMYYTLYDQSLLISRLEYTRESSGYSVRKLRLQENLANITEQALENDESPDAVSAASSNDATRLLQLHHYLQTQKELKKLRQGKRRKRQGF